VISAVALGCRRPLAFDLGADAGVLELVAVGEFALSNNRVSESSPDGSRSSPRPLGRTAAGYDAVLNGPKPSQRARPAAVSLSQIQSDSALT
jgi:hypothetical protein